MIRKRSLGKKTQMAMLALVLGLLLAATAIFGFGMIGVSRTMSASNRNLNRIIRDDFKLTPTQFEREFAAVAPY